MSFSADLNKFTIKTKAVTNSVYVGFAGAVQESVKIGRPETGAPGQPVDTGFLRDSWILDVGPTVANLTTNVNYAPAVEHNDRSRFDAAGVENDRKKLEGGGSRKSIKSKVGGNHSVKLTVAGADRLMATVVRQVVG